MIVAIVAAGGNFWDGLRQGVITAGLNEALHSVVSKAMEPPKSGAKGGKVKLGSHKISSEALLDGLDLFSKYLGEELSTSPKEISIASGDRDQSRNGIIGGASRSRHLFGDAADISVDGLSNIDVAKYAYKSGLFKTVIYYPEIAIEGALRPHVHVDHAPKNNNLFLIYTGPELTPQSTIRHTYKTYRP